MSSDRVAFGPGEDLCWVHMDPMPNRRLVLEGGWSLTSLRAVAGVIAHRGHPPGLTLPTHPVTTFRLRTGRRAACPELRSGFRNVPRPRRVVCPFPVL